MPNKPEREENYNRARELINKVDDKNTRSMLWEQVGNNTNIEVSPF